MNGEKQKWIVVRRGPRGFCEDFSWIKMMGIDPVARRSPWLPHGLPI